MLGHPVLLRLFVGVVLLVEELCLDLHELVDVLVLELAVLLVLVVHGIQYLINRHVLRFYCPEELHYSIVHVLVHFLELVPFLQEFWSVVRRRLSSRRLRILVLIYRLGILLGLLRAVWLGWRLPFLDLCGLYLLAARSYLLGGRLLRLACLLSLILAFGVGWLLLALLPGRIFEGQLIKFVLRLGSGPALLFRAGLQLVVRGHIGSRLLRLLLLYLLFHGLGTSGLSRLLGNELLLLHDGLLWRLHLGLLLLNGTLLLVRYLRVLSRLDLLVLIVVLKFVLDLVAELLVRSLVLVKVHLEDELAGDHFRRVLLQLIVKSYVVVLDGDLHLNGLRLLGVDSLLALLLGPRGTRLTGSLHHLRRSSVKRLFFELVWIRRLRIA